MTLPINPQSDETIVTPPTQATATPPADPGATPPAATPPATDTIQISKQEYAQLMTQIAFMQNQLESVTKPADPPPSYAGKDINQLTNAEMFDLFNRQSEQQQQQVVNALMQIAVKEEIRDLGDTYPDFKSDKATRDAVLSIAEKNTQLSLEQAYLIYKGKKPPEAAPPTTPTPPPASKPTATIAPHTVTPSKTMTVREAAEAALKSLNYE